MRTSIRLLCFGLIIALVGSSTSTFAFTLNLPAGTLTPGFGIKTRVGTFDGAVVYAPRPALPRAALPRHFRGHGVFILDLNTTRGYVNVARVFKSTGSEQVDSAIVATLQQWRVQPRMIYKLYVPVTVTSGGKLLFGSP